MVARGAGDTKRSLLYGVIRFNLNYFFYEIIGLFRMREAGAKDVGHRFNTETRNNHIDFLSFRGAEFSLAIVSCRFQ